MSRNCLIFAGAAFGQGLTDDSGPALPDMPEPRAGRNLGKRGETLWIVQG